MYLHKNLKGHFFFFECGCKKGCWSPTQGEEGGKGQWVGGAFIRGFSTLNYQSTEFQRVAQVWFSSVQFSSVPVSYTHLTLPTSDGV